MNGYMLLYSLYDNRLQSEDDQRQPDSSNTIQKTIDAINDSGRNLTTNPVPLDVNTLAVLLQNLFHQEGTAMFASNTMLTYCLHFPAYACYHYLYQSRTEAYFPLKTGETGETSLSDSSPTDEETDEDRVHDIQHKTFQWLRDKLKITDTETPFQTFLGGIQFLNWLYFHHYSYRVPSYTKYICFHYTPDKQAIHSADRLCEDFFEQMLSGQLRLDDKDLGTRCLLYTSPSPRD